MGFQLGQKITAVQAGYQKFIAAFYIRVQAFENNFLKYWVKNFSFRAKDEINGQFWTIVRPITQSNFCKKSFKGTLMAIRMLFRGNLWKMSQQIGVNLDKNAILG